MNRSLLFLKTILLSEEGYQVDTTHEWSICFGYDQDLFARSDSSRMDTACMARGNGLRGESGANTNVPIIVVTSCTDQEDLLTAFNAGADDYISTV
jgi:DNA-binding response OmpR family regulator